MRRFYLLICISVIILAISLIFLPYGVTLYADTTSDNTSTPNSSDNQTTSNLPGGGSWSEGHGGLAANNKMIYGFGTLINDAGQTYDNFEFVSFDNLATLRIPSGSTVLNKAGGALRVFTITNVTETDTPQDGVILIGAEYDFEPEGATLSPPVLLSIEYYRDDLPENITEDMLTIAQWDSNTKTFVPLDATLNQNKQVLTTYISYFSRYAIVAIPMPLETSTDETITPQTSVTANQSKTITPTIIPGTTPDSLMATSIPTPTPTPSPTINPEIVDNVPATSEPAETAGEQNNEVSTPAQIQSTGENDVNSQPVESAPAQDQGYSLALYLSGACLLATAIILIVLWRKRS